MYTMQANAMKIQQLQCRADELNAIIVSRNTPGALDSHRQLLQADKDRYINIASLVSMPNKNGFPVLVMLHALLTGILLCLFP